MKNVCVFLSANDLEEKYVEPAKEFGRLLAQNHFGLVYGGSDKGLMKVVADTVQKAGGKVIGITVEMMKHFAKKNVDEMLVANDLPERKKLMAEKSDATVVMAGGLGTLDEATELIELKVHGLYPKPIIFLNTVGFYDELYSQLCKMETEGFLVKRLDELVMFYKTPKEVIDYLISV